MRHLVVILILLILSISCKENNADAEVATREPGSAPVQTTKNKSHFDVFYETENVRLYGDTTIDKEKIVLVSLKFEPYIGFEDFRVPAVDHNKRAGLDLKSNKHAPMFRTRLREGYASDTANFAGHYTFVYWGCGSPCQSSLLIDRKTGKIYDAPEANLGYDFRSTSRMMIVNRPDSGGFYNDCIYCKPIIYIFDEATKKFTERRKGWDQGTNEQSDQGVKTLR